MTGTTPGQTKPTELAVFGFAVQNTVIERELQRQEALDIVPDDDDENPEDQLLQNL